ncbi:DDE-type integrase/transposase/recombinase [Myxococcus sp. CA051A]|uniref:DDE-type integrase/transposase/recombinase n=1 Tax=Myxococcus sp. CA051A TaxID=2741739 RepID=UPI00157B0F27|nr:DDE-type integrase/transposase/recombinase [Myxococcus sp. CA051A]
MSDRHLTLKALDMALRRRCPAQGLLHHTDEGSTYASADYQHVLVQHGLVCSMSRRANCYDNAAMESWFSTLKNELGEVFERANDAKVKLINYMRSSTINSACIRQSATLRRPSSKEQRRSQPVHRTGSLPRSPRPRVTPGPTKGAGNARPGRRLPPVQPSTPPCVAGCTPAGGAGRRPGPSPRKEGASRLALLVHC